ncbi:hypothetical protein U1Q18_033200 [Sarracenia purpurea var. burkii]
MEHDGVTRSVILRDASQRAGSCEIIVRERKTQEVTRRNHDLSSTINLQCRPSHRHHFDRARSDIGATRPHRRQRLHLALPRRQRQWRNRSKGCLDFAPATQGRCPLDLSDHLEPVDFPCVSEQNQWTICKQTWRNQLT